MSGKHTHIQLQLPRQYLGKHCLLAEHRYDV